MYDPTWRAEDEKRIQWLEKLYFNYGRHKKDHPQHGTYTGLVAKHGPCPWA
jgi:hypothetical protein